MLAAVVFYQDFDRGLGQTLGLICTSGMRPELFE